MNADAESLAARLLASSSRRWRHVQAVAGHAAALASAVVPPDVAAIVVAAAWLHDIGYSPTLAVSGFHALDGAVFLRNSCAFPASVELLVAHHTGAAVEAEERGLTDDLRRFDAPSSELLDLVTTADLVSGPGGRWVRADDRVREILERYHDDSPVHRAVTRSSPELLATVARVEARLVAVGAPPAQPM